LSPIPVWTGVPKAFELPLQRLLSKTVSEKLAWFLTKGPLQSPDTTTTPDDNTEHNTNQRDAEERKPALSTIHINTGEVRNLACIYLLYSEVLLYIFTVSVETVQSTQRSF
jgi:predicted small lipoprotein YifL